MDLYKIMIFGTIGIVLLFIVLSFFFIKNKNLWGTISIGILIIAVSLICSYSALFKNVSKPKDLFSFISPSIIFIFIFFIALLILFWILMLIVGIFNRERITEFGAKIFGVELSHKFATEDLVLAKEGYDKLELQIAIINALNTQVLEFISTPFENFILESKDKPSSDIIRKIVAGVLNEVYSSYNPGICIYVIPLKDIESLDDFLATIIYKYLPKVVSNFSTTTYNDKIGIGVHLGEEEELNTVIIIDTINTDYQLSLSEICIASSLFVSLSTIIDWAEQSKKIDDNQIV